MRPFAVACAAMLVLACRDMTQPVLPESLAIAVIRGDQQTDTIGAQLQVVTVRVTGQPAGRSGASAVPAAGIEVAFDAAGGVIVATPGVTNEDGEVSALWRLPEDTGRVLLRVSAGPATVQVVARAIPGAPAALVWSPPPWGWVDSIYPLGARALDRKGHHAPAAISVSSRGSVLNDTYRSGLEWHDTVVARAGAVADTAVITSLTNLGAFQYLIVVQRCRSHAAFHGAPADSLLIDFRGQPDSLVRHGRTAGRDSLTFYLSLPARVWRGGSPFTDSALVVLVETVRQVPDTITWVRNQARAAREGSSWVGGSFCDGWASGEALRFGLAR